MEYVYAALLIHELGGKLEESTVKKVVEAAGGKADDARVKALVASLEGVNIKEAIEKAAVVAPVASPSVAPAAEKKEDKKKAAEEEKKNEEAAAAGLGALFG